MSFFCRITATGEHFVRSTTYAFGFNHHLDRAQQVTRAVFPGSFDPLTQGHVDLVYRALKMFDEVCVAVLVNEVKQPLFSVDERLTFIQAAIPHDRVNVASFEGLLVDFARSIKADVLVRGLRAVSDFEYEGQMAMMNRELDPDLETVFLMPKTEYSFLSSRVVKEVARLGGDVSHLVPKTVMKAFDAKFGSNQYNNKGMNQ